MEYTWAGKTVRHIDIQDPVFERIFNACGGYSMWTLFHSIEPLYTMYRNVCHVVEHRVPGDIVECGVWAGGMMKLAAMTLAHLGDTSRKLYLYDTFAGMPEPGERDRTTEGHGAHQAWLEYREKGEKWAFGGTRDEVARVVCDSGYPRDKILLVEGMVESTIPDTMPADAISILRLDTDFYQSTRHELIHLYPKLTVGGVLIIDDYGYYQGAREATDEYLREVGAGLLLTRVNVSVHQGVKLHT